MSPEVDVCHSPPPLPSTLESASHRCKGWEVIRLSKVALSPKTRGDMETLVGISPLAPPPPASLSSQAPDRCDECTKLGVIRPSKMVLYPDSDDVIRAYIGWACAFAPPELESAPHHCNE